MHLKGYVDVADPRVTNGAKERLEDLTDQWSGFASERDQIIEVEMKAFNDLYSELKLPAIIMDK